MWDRWERLRYHIKGYKVIWINVVLGLPVVFDLLQQIVAGLMGLDLTPILPPGYGKIVATILAILNIVLRVCATTAPWGQKGNLPYPPRRDGPNA